MQPLCTKCDHMFQEHYHGGVCGRHDCDCSFYLGYDEKVVDPSTVFEARKKPVEIEAMHFNGTADSAKAIFTWISNNIKTHGPHDAVRADIEAHNGVSTLYIDTLEGVMEAPSGWWIIRGVKGEFYPCRDDIFQETYDIIER